VLDDLLDQPDSRRKVFRGRISDASKRGVSIGVAVNMVNVVNVV
jgi:hypothetical protein